MPTPETVIYNFLCSVGAAIYLAALIVLLVFLVVEGCLILKERKKIMEFQVYQIDSWTEPDGSWRYNNSFPVCKVSIKGEPTTRKIIKALRDINLLPSADKLRVKVDDYFDYEGTWMVQERSNSRPLFDLIDLT